MSEETLDNMYTSVHATNLHAIANERASQSDAAAEAAAAKKRISTFKACLKAAQNAAADMGRTGTKFITAEKISNDPVIVAALGKRAIKAVFFEKKGGDCYWDCEHAWHYGYDLSW